VDVGYRAVHASWFYCDVALPAPPQVAGPDDAMAGVKSTRFLVTLAAGAQENDTDTSIAAYGTLKDVGRPAYGVRTAFP